jgi:heptosyltransferase-2
VFLPNWIGDAVMSTPALRAIRTREPDSRVTAVVRPNVQDVLSGLDLADDLIAFDHHCDSTMSFVGTLRQTRPEVAVLFPNSFRSAWYAWLSGARERVGLNRYARGPLLTKAVSARDRRIPHPCMEDYARIVAAMGCPVTDSRLEAAVLPADAERMNRYWRKAVGRCDPPPTYIALNPGGAFGAAKHWPVEHFADLARRIVNELGTRVLVVCGPAERDSARQIVAAADSNRVTSLADESPSLGLTKAAIRQARLLVTTDSGPRHFAAAFDVPVVTVFGPTHPAWSENGFRRAVHVQLSLPCGPCQERVCPEQHHKCMRDLGPGRVFDAVQSLLQREGVIPPPLVSVDLGSHSSDVGLYSPDVGSHSPRRKEAA